MLFIVALSGHERYLADLANNWRTSPGPDGVAALRARHDIQQLTQLMTAAPPAG
jgi:hypothetical protein